MALLNPKFLSKMPKKYSKLLTDNTSFCILPWMHMHTSDSGKTTPCCMYKSNDILGNANVDSLESIWNDKPMREIRQRMLAGELVEGCKLCYEKDLSGIYSHRQKMNVDFKHNIILTDNTKEDGSLSSMKLKLWDIRFSNLCNMKCRTCSSKYSSNWHDDERKLSEINGIAFNKDKVVSSGRTEDDIFDQFSSQLENMERIYFAGGEPLIMEEHYRALNEMIDRNLTDIDLIYNTNFSQLRFKKTNVLEKWNKFSKVTVVASLDAMGARAEYIRKGTVWEKIEQNRKEMMKISPNVHFLIGPAVSIFNIQHIPDFQKTWFELGYLKINNIQPTLVQQPIHYRIDIMPAEMKKRVEEKYVNHIEWLESEGATQNTVEKYQQIINFMNYDDKSNLIPMFILKTRELDMIRNENILDILPELKELFNEI